MTFTNLEKYVYSKKCLKQRRQPPPTQIDLKVSLEEDTIIPFPKGEHRSGNDGSSSRFQNTVSCCYLSSGVSYNTPNIYF